MSKGKTEKFQAPVLRFPKDLVKNYKAQKKFISTYQE